MSDPSHLFANKLYSKKEEARNFSKSDDLYRGGEDGFSQVPEPKGKLGIFSSPRAYTEETVRRDKLRTVVEVGGETQIFVSLRAYLEEKVRRVNTRQKAARVGGKSTKFFQVPEPM